MDKANCEANQGDSLVDICIFDNGTTHTILKDKKNFSKIKPTRTVVNTITGHVDLIEGIGMAHFTLPNGTKITINNALFSPRSKRNLLSSKDIYSHGFDTQSFTEGTMKYMCLTTSKFGKR